MSEPSANIHCVSCQVNSIFIVCIVLFTRAFSTIQLAKYYIDAKILADYVRPSNCASSMHNACKEGEIESVGIR